jgi:hypothetical protein
MYKLGLLSLITARMERLRICILQKLSVLKVHTIQSVNLFITIANNRGLRADP